MARGGSLLAVERRGVFATLIGLYRGDESFRFLADLAIIGGVVVWIMSPGQAGPGERPVSRSPAQTMETAPAGFPEYAAILRERRSRSDGLAAVTVEFKTDTSNFNSSPPEVRNTLIEVSARLDVRDMRGAAELISPLDPDDPNVAYLLADMLIGNASPEAQRRALGLYQEAARKGQRQAAAALGLVSMLGLGGAGIDKDLGRRFLEQAAAAGDVFAARVLGRVLGNGWLGVVDLPKAARYTEQAADGGSVPAMIEAAANYLGGRGVEADSIKALEYALRAAGQGSPEGDLLAGNLYMLQYGIGMQKDLGLAVRFLEKALAQQRVEAALVLGSIYTSIAKEPEWHDPARGAAYFQQCAAALVPACLFAYGQTLEAGSGVARDSVGAYAYFALAREGGVPRAEGRLAVLTTELTQAERQLAVERARQIISQNSRAARSAILSPMWQ